MVTIEAVASVSSVGVRLRSVGQRFRWKAEGRCVAW